VPDKLKTFHKIATFALLTTVLLSERQKYWVGMSAKVWHLLFARFISSSWLKSLQLMFTLHVIAVKVLCI